MFMSAEALVTFKFTFLTQCFPSTKKTFHLNPFTFWLIAMPDLNGLVAPDWLKIFLLNTRMGI
jgi:hypothetical protein